VQERTVTLLDPLRQDLKRWRAHSGRITGLMFPGDDGAGWDTYDWDNWRTRIFRPAAAAAKLPEGVRPRDLRGSFASLLIQEGRSIVDVAKQLGHSPAICLRDYASVFEEFDPTQRRDAAEVIGEAREKAARAFPADHERVDGEAV
jgi:integrase